MKPTFVNLTRVLFFFVAVVLTGRVGRCQSVPTNGLVGLYTFNTNLNDTTGISANGILNGGGVAYVPDRFGTPSAALHFAGGGFVSITPTPVDVNSDYTMTFWTRLDNANNTPYNLFSTAEDVQGGMNFRMYPGVFGWAFVAQGNNGPTSLTPTDYTDWHGVVCVHEETNDYMYIDGALVTSGGHTDPVLDNGSLWLGRHQNPGGFNYDLAGTMDEVRFYDRALSVGEVSQLYTYEAIDEAPPPVTPPPPALVGYYRFDGNANDSTTNQNNGVTNGTGITFTTDRFGSSNAAVHFAGGGYISLTPTPINVGADYTVGCWVKLDSSASTPYNLISTAQDTFGGMNVRTYAGAFGWTFIAKGPNGVDSAAPTNFAAWHSLMCVHQGTNDLFYIDGILRNTGGHTNQTTDNGTIWLGRHQSSATYDLHGSLDDVRFYNYALTNTEVAQVYSNDTVGLTETAQASGFITNGFFYQAVITDAGLGYTNTPLVHIVGGGGAGAVASAVISNGMVVAINVSNPGSNYATLPLVVIDPPIVPNPALAISPAALLTFSNLSLGTNYQVQSLQNSSWINVSSSFAATNSVYAQYFPGRIDPSTYRLVASPAPATALATAQVINGFFVGASITSPGSGYTADATIVVSGGGGTNGAAVAQVGGGVVTNIHILSPGSGYTSPPTLMIAPPPTPPSITPTALAVIRIDASHLTLYDNYQIKYTQNLASGWSNYPGGLITSTNATNSQYLSISNGIRFFRLQLTP